MKRTNGILAIAASFFVMLFVLMCSSAAYAQNSGTVTLDYDPKANPVADRTVHIQVNKLESSSHEFVKGAHLQIIDKETGQVVADWTSDGTTQNSARELDIDKVYILHEVEAPAGYEKAADVEFILRSVNFETKGEVISGATTESGETNAEFSNVSGDIETQAFVISLYDKQSPAERTVTEQRERERETENNKTNNNTTTTQNSNTTNNQTTTKNTSTTSGSTTSGGGSLTKTSDDTSYVPIIVIGVIGIGVIAFAIYKRRR